MLGDFVTMDCQSYLTTTLTMLNEVTDQKTTKMMKDK